MAAKNSKNAELSLAQVVELYGFPTMPELLRDGVSIKEDLYRALIKRFLAHYLAPFFLGATPLDDGGYLLAPLPGYTWHEAAYHLGHVVNLTEGEVKVRAAEDFLTRGVPEGEKAHPDLERAVLANLEVLPLVAVAFGMANPREAFTKAAGDAFEALKARGAA